MDSRTSKAWLNIAQLADQACSEDVRLKANRVFLEAAGELGGSGADAAKVASALVQIVINQGQNAAHLPHGQLAGVIEAKPYQPAIPDASNSRPVGHADSEEDGA